MDVRNFFLENFLKNYFLNLLLRAAVNWTVVNDRRACAIPGLHMPVNRIKTCVELAATKPLVKGRVPASHQRMSMGKPGPSTS